MVQQFYRSEADQMLLGHMCGQGPHTKHHPFSLLCIRSTQELELPAGGCFSLRYFDQNNSFPGEE